MQKRSLTISGHRTSLALEPEFWNGLEAMRTEKAISLGTLIRQIDDQREGRNLSSAIRVAVLLWYKQKVP